MDTKYLEIIKAPIITEKSARLGQDEGKYFFKVDPRATKIEIKTAIEKIFNVKVVDISTINVKPKKKKVGRYAGMSNKYKKAVVTLLEGQTINIG